MFVIDRLNLIFYLRFSGMVNSLPVFQVVIIGIWINGQSFEQPSDTKNRMIFFNKPVRR